MKNIQAFVTYRGISNFSFRPVSFEEVKKIIQDLKTNKAVGGKIPTKILKEYEFTFDVLTNCINKSIETGYFPDSLKLANVTPVFKKEDPFKESNYRLVSISPLLSKGYEKVINNQLPDYFQSFLNNILCCFRKAHTTQYALFKLIQSWQQVLDNGGFIGTILMDLPKAYDCISHNLLTAKSECYGVDKASLRLSLDYLTRRKQQIKIGSSLALGAILIQACLKGQSLVLFYLIYLSTIHFFHTKVRSMSFCR